MASGLNIAQLLTDLNSFVVGGLSPRLVLQSDEGSAIELSGEIVDEEGEPVGDAVRRYVRGDGYWKASHTRLHLEEAVRGRGFGRGFHRHSEAVYRAHGIRRIEIFAQEKGAYAWHSEAFQLAGLPERRRKQCVDIWRRRGGRERATEALQEGRVTQEDFDAAEAEFSRVERGDRAPMEPSEIAAIASDKMWQDVDGHQVWLGRVILTDSQWAGLKEI